MAEAISGSRELVTVDPISAQLPAVFEAELQRAADRAKSAKAAATRRAYGSDWRIFGEWCQSRGLAALPAAPEAVAAFLNAEADRGVKPSTITRRAAAIRYAHKAAGYEPPTGHEAVRLTMAGIRRDLGTAPNKKRPATADKLVAMAAAGDGSLIGLRDRAVLLIGFAGAFRRSELAALDVADIQEVAEGLRITVRKSKTDQEGKGFVKALPRGSIACPVEALKAWLAAGGITEGPVFRPINRHGKVRPQRLTDHSIAAIVKARAARLGLDPAQFAGHSLRSGFVTSAAQRGASLFKLMDVTGHKSVDTLRGYVRDAELFKDHAGAGLL
jgi:site-specific recombinase XerD